MGDGRAAFISVWALFHVRVFVCVCVFVGVCVLMCVCVCLCVCVFLRKASINGDCLCAVAIVACVTGSAVLNSATLGGKGTVIVILNEAAKTIEYSVTVTKLSGAVTAAHFHGPASIGANAGVLLGLDGLVSKSSVSGIYTAVTVEQFEYFKSGKVYCNIHTQANGGGEIRGQVIVDTANVGVGVLSGAKSVPAGNSFGSGTLAVRLVDGGTALSYSLTLSDNLSGTITAAHFHGPADTTGNAGVLEAILGLNATSLHTEGKWVNISANNIGFLKSGKIYVNVHTTSFASGEVRSQVDGTFTAPATPAATLLYGMGV